MSSLRIPTPNPSLIERGFELDALRSAVRGGGGVVLLEAAAGLGKTTLLDEGAALAGATGWTVRRAAPSPLERSLPFGVLRALLETPTRERPSVIDGAATAAGALLLDGVRAGRDVLTMAHSVLWLCSGLGPLALVVDDAQWADRESLGVLAYLARRIEDLPLLILVGTRASCDLLRLVGGVRAAAVLHPAPLSASGAARLARRVDPSLSGPVCRDLHRAAGGVPWLVAELARGKLSPGGRDVVRRRLAELERADRAVAEALAVVGDDVSPHVLAAIAGLDVGALGAAFDGLAAAGLTRGTRFVHKLVAEAIASDLPRTARETLHRAAARALAAAGADAGTVAAHLLECAPTADPEVTRWLVAAAEQARAAPAPDVPAAPGQGGPVPVGGVEVVAHVSLRGADAAVVCLRRALEEGAPGDDRGALLAALGVAAFDAGLPDACGWLFTAAEECDVRSDDVVARLAAYGVVVGDSDAVLDAFLDEPGEHARQIALRPGTDSALLAHRAWVALGRGEPSAPRLALAALADGRLLLEADARRAYELCARVLVATGHAAADETIAALRAAATTVRMRAAATSLAAEHALRRGHVVEAEALARTALAFPAPFRDGALALLVHALAERGETGDAHAALRTAARDEPRCLTSIVRARESGRAASELATATARLALADGDFAAALDAVGHGALGRREGAARDVDGALAAVALAHLGRREEAARVAEAALVEARRLGAPAPIAAALHARAIADPDAERRITLCERGLALDPGGLEAVRLRLALGSALAYVGRRVEARDALRPALADADAFGATPLSDRARRELVATGLRPRQAALEGTAALTPRQRQICELAAVGKGNRVIAQELFLSIKTVETHLAAGYRKLGVNTRAELATELAQAA